MTDDHQIAANADDVFINCRFDPEWHDNFEALAFAVIACGFHARCAREITDAAGTRLDKLYKIIAESRFGIHDISCVELDQANGLPRFNMPLELGFFLASRQYGGVGQKDKRCIVFETEPYRYQMFISDLNGMDIVPHHNDPLEMIGKVRDFLKSVTKRKTIPTAYNLRRSYAAFLQARPVLLAGAKLGHDQLEFADFEELVVAWVRSEAGLGTQN